MDADSLIHLEHPRSSYKCVSAISMLHYGPKVSVPRILDTYKELDIRQTIYVPAWCIEQYPDAVKVTKFATMVTFMKTHLSRVLRTNVNGYVWVFT